MKKYFLFLLVIIICFGCAASLMHDITITKTDNGKSLYFKKGSQFSVVLDGNPTTGFSWYVTSLDTTIAAQTGAYDYQANTNLLGSPGKFTFKFHVKEAGSTILKFHYFRSFEKNVAPVDSFYINIIVK